MVSLPDRRAHFVQSIKWAGANWLVGVGLDPEGRAIEVFIDLADPEAEVIPAVVRLVHSFAITTSHYLRTGARAADHATRLECQDPDVMVLALRAAAEIEAAHGPLVRKIEVWRRQRLAGEVIDITAELAEVRALVAAELAAEGLAEVTP
jgi:hypothetical protein